MSLPKRGAIGVIWLCCSLSIGAILLFSCSRQSPDTRFLYSLSQIDARISAGDSSGALKKLLKLRSEAKSARQWLSLVKRERALDAYGQSLVTLKKAQKQIPVNVELTAVLVDTLTHLELYDEACTHTEALLDTPYAGVAPLPEIIRDGKNGLFRINPLFWEEAYTVTGNPFFHRNAAVLYAASGNYAAACALEAKTPTGPPPSDENYFHALLCYDAGFPDQVFVYLDRNAPEKRNFAELALLADASVKQNDISAARVLWQIGADRSRTVPSAARSPLPFYNLAATDSDPIDEKNNLETCLSYFPTFYPAVCRYVRSVPLTPPEQETDPVARELLKAGFLSLEMEARAKRQPINAASAERVLAMAIKAPGGTVDNRLYIEEFRFNQLKDLDTLRSASQMWKLLERFPTDRSIHEYALWYFSVIGNYDASFALNRSSPDTESAFYSGLELASTGSLEKAVESFALVANNSQDSWCALANIAQIHEKMEDYGRAIEELTTAVSLAPNDIVRSDLHYRAAEAQIQQRSPDLAINELRFALETNPGNYRAAALLRELEAEK